MSETVWHERFFASTRGQVVKLLRRSPATVEDLARQVGLTDNGVRAHLDLLARDGLVRQQGVRRGRGKPAFLYVLTPDADRLFPKAYEAVLGALLEVLAARSPDQLESALVETGRLLGSVQSRRAGDVRDRAEAAVRVLNDLGGMAELEETDEGLSIRGYDCPLAATVSQHPAACRLARALVAEIVGARTEERCEREGRQRCHFVIATS